MLIPVPQGESTLVYPASNSTPISPYNDSLTAVLEQCECKFIEAYTPTARINAFTTFEPGKSYKIIAKSAFVIDTDN